MNTLKNMSLLVSDSDKQYFIEDVGQNSCQNGTKVMNAQDCTSACNTLEKNMGKMKDGKACYIAGNGKCRQDGRHGARARLVCMNKGNVHYVIFIQIH